MMMLMYFVEKVPYTKTKILLDETGLELKAEKY
jgi:hypothetical protein